MALPDASLAVVGAKYPNAHIKGPTRLFELAMCSPGEPVDLRPEPRNPADPRAIAVFSCRGYQIGYLTAERAARIGQLIHQGEVRAIFQLQTDFGAYIRASFDGNDPVLPPDSDEEENNFAEPDWTPDPEWPDE